MGKTGIAAETGQFARTRTAISRCWEGAEPVKGDAVGRTACSLPWLCPSAEALLTLGDAVPDVAVLEGDLAFCVHLARFARPSLTPQDAPFSRESLAQPSLSGGASTLLQSLNHKKALRFVQLPADMQRQLDAAVEQAETAATLTTTVPTGLAGWVVRLTALGWAAVSAVDPEGAARCWADPAHKEQSAALEREYFGFDTDAVMRRLVSVWRFPRWLSAILVSLQLPIADAERLGAPSELLRIVRAALPNPKLRQNAPSRTHLSSAEIPNPDAIRLIIRMLRNTAEIRRRSPDSLLAAAEKRIDELTNLLGELRADFDYELRDAKLAGLAEFAAGAGHEINNPLAVISGNAQLILAKEDDPGTQKSLHTIIRQTKRIHDILQGTRHFARPPLPMKETIEPARWLPAVVAGYEPEADPKGLSLTIDPTTIDRTWKLEADPLQLRQILGQLIRNGIDAAPRGGWVRVSVEATLRSFRIIVEDNGEGPKPEHLEHLFDPFFSGRSAGRGRGIGLSIAWRLAQLNGGDVRYCRITDGPTRFVLSLPREEAPAMLPAKSA